MRTLLRGGSVYSPADPHATAIAVDDGVVSWIGDDTGAGSYANGADEVVDLDGRLVTPAFVDAHLHTVQLGFMLSGLDLTKPATLAECLDAVAAHASRTPADELIVGHGWDETRWSEARPPTADELERAAPGRKIYLSRRDGHSAVISAALEQAIPGLRDRAGWGPDGRMERDAHHGTRDGVAAMIPAAQRRAAADTAVRHLASLGIGSFHEMAAPHICPPEELAVVKAAADDLGVHPVLYWGEAGAFERAAELGVRGLAGDLVADGALGSRTAALREPYADRPDHRGHAYLTAEQIAAHVIGCTETGLQAGFHCIGDDALGNVACGFDLAAEKVGVPALIAARHRLEHVEMPDADAVATFARCGIVASMQPMFDGLWGGPDGMYAERVGARVTGMNPLATLAQAGVVLAFGSDAPVTEPGPWAAVRAAAFHHEPAQRLTVRAAFAAHTRGGWRAAGVDDGGVLAPGAPATYAVWDTDAELVVQTPDDRVAAWSTDPRAGVPVLPDLTDELPVCVRTVVAGRVAYEEAS